MTSLADLKAILAKKDEEATLLKNNIAELRTKLNDVDSLRQRLSEVETQVNQYLGVTIQKPLPAPVAIPGFSNNGDSVPLRAYVVQVLEQANKPLTIKELTNQVLDAGYQTQSENFESVVMTCISGLANKREVVKVTPKSVRPGKYAIPE